MTHIYVRACTFNVCRIKHALLQEISACTHMPVSTYNTPEMQYTVQIDVLMKINFIACQFLYTYVCTYVYCNILVAVEK